MRPVAQAYLPNFWSGIYLMFAGCCLGLLDAMLSCCAALGGSIRLLITTQAINQLLQQFNYVNEAYLRF
jgi:hypothetical protein